MTEKIQASPVPAAAGAIPVLLYHSVSDAPAGRFGPFTVSRSQLAAHLDLLLERGYQPITVRTLLDGLASGQLPPRPVVLTFDDGFADYAANAWPLLAERGLAATLYVTAGDLGGHKPSGSPCCFGLRGSQIGKLGAPTKSQTTVDGVEKAEFQNGTITFDPATGEVTVDLK